MDYKLEFEKLFNVMIELRAKCPWDIKQTNETLRYLTIEECYELSDAILENNPNLIKEELGDILLHVLFYTIIGHEKETQRGTYVDHVSGHFSLIKQKNLKRSYKLLEVDNRRKKEGFETLRV